LWAIPDWQTQRDVYICPQGQILAPGWVDLKGIRIQYHALTPVCRACPVRDYCTSHGRGRLIYRSFHADYLERVCSYHVTPAFQKAMRKRRGWVEPVFAEANQWHHLEKFRLPGRRKVNMEVLLIAAGQNLKRWLQTTGWGRRPFPGGSGFGPLTVVLTYLSSLYLSLGRSGV
jgi:Transposase DDE domain